jgi:hypothetical protein
MSDPKELNELVDIGLVTKVSGIFPLGNREGDQPAIWLQMESLSGKIYFASLSVEAARDMVLGLSNWQPVQDILSERGPRPKISDLESPD